MVLFFGSFLRCFSYDVGAAILAIWGAHAGLTGPWCRSDTETPTFYCPKAVPGRWALSRSVFPTPAIGALPRRSQQKRTGRFFSPLAPGSFLRPWFFLVVLFPATRFFFRRRGSFFGLRALGTAAAARHAAGGSFFGCAAGSPSIFLHATGIE